MKNEHFILIVGAVLVLGCGDSEKAALSSFEALAKTVEEKIPAAITQKYGGDRSAAIDGTQTLAWGNPEIKEPLSFDVKSTPSREFPYHASVSFSWNQPFNYQSNEGEFNSLWVFGYSANYVYENKTWKCNSVSMSRRIKFVSGDNRLHEEEVAKIPNDAEFTHTPDPEWPANVRQNPISGLLINPYQ